MSTRGIGDGYAFQRLLWLLVATVIVPTVLLALYGGLAIRNQNAWIKERVRKQQHLRLQDAARHLFTQIEVLDAGVRELQTRCQRDGTPCIPDRAGVEAVWVWSMHDDPPALLRSVGIPLVASSDTVWFNPSDGSHPIGIFSTKEHKVAWQLDVPALQDVLADRLADRWDDGMRCALEGATPGPATPVDEMLASWQEPEVGLLLERPLNAWRLVAQYPDDSVARMVGRTEWISPLALVILVTLVIVGTVITLRAASREIRLSRLQTDFVSSVSHELRTPLTSIRLFVETLQSGRLDNRERIDECLELLATETERLSRTIERVLGWARMEAGRRVYDLEVVEADDLIDDALSALRSQHLLSEEVEIDVQLPKPVPLLLVDRDAIVEALLNLLQNAVKHTPTPRHIGIEAIGRGNEVGLAVHDNGPGIAKADRKRIFEKFYQADTLLSSPIRAGAERGSGLGLSIVRAVVKGHGGRVQLDSELGQGSRFTLWLPMAPRTR